MGKVLLIWTYESDMIECPDYISNNIIVYVNKFDKWMFDKNNQHNTGQRIVSTMMQFALEVMTL
jgi:hypothetical protein